MKLCQLQEGVGAEAAAFSAHEQLDNLIIMYDSNDVTLDKMAEFTQSESVADRYRAYGWDVVTVDGHDLGAVAKVRFVFQTAWQFSSSNRWSAKWNTFVVRAGEASPCFPAGAMYIHRSRLHCSSSLSPSLVLLKNRVLVSRSAVGRFRMAVGWYTTDLNMVA